MELLPNLLRDLPRGVVTDVRIGIHWTAVCIQSGGKEKCGLASTLQPAHEHTGIPDVPEAGRLQGMPGEELASFCMDKDHPTLCSLGMAALNALLLVDEESIKEVNAEEILGNFGDQQVVLVGHFPFVKQLRYKLKKLIVLELNPGPDDLPAEDAPILIPTASVVAITGMTLLNHTLEGLLELCQPSATVMVLGPTTPLDRRLFDYGIDILSGAVVSNIQEVLNAVSQGGNFKQVNRAGLQLATFVRPGLVLPHG